MKGLIGKKVGMTQVYDEKGVLIPVTVVQAGPCVVTGVKTVERDGYSAVQLGFGERKAKNVTKAQILEYLCRKGLARKRSDGSLPDDRKVREAARELLKQGLPIMATAQNKGYFVAETIAEIDRPQRQNKARAVAILAVDKGYEKVRALLSGQGRIFGA